MARVKDFVIGSLGESYPGIVEDVLRFGYEVDSRAGMTRNLKNVQIILLNPIRSLVSRKGMSDAFAREEATQLLAGAFDRQRLAAIAPRAAEMITAATAYGPRVSAQLLGVERELRENPNSRRAVVYVGRHDDLYHSGDESRAREMPCTLTWQFDLTEGALDMTVNMRSNDAVWGLSYDIPSFTAVQRAMAVSLGVPLGTYFHQAGSFHVYERHYGIETDVRMDDEFVLGFNLGRSMAETMETATAVLKEDYEWGSTS